MKFLPLLAAIVTLIVLLSKNFARSKKKKRLVEMRRRWGLPNAGYYNFDYIGKYANINREGIFHTLSNQTKSDIDFFDLFSFADHTNSRVGQQYLFDALSKPGNDPAALKELDKQIDFFSGDATAREETQLLLSELNDDNAYHIASLLSGELPEKPAWFNLVIADIILTVVLIVLSFYFPVLLAWLMLPLAVNLALHYWNKNNTFYFATSLPPLNRLVNTCRKIAEMNLPFNRDGVKTSIGDLKKFQRTMRMLGLRQSNLGADAELIVYYLVDMIKAFFLVELLAYFSLIKELKSKQAAIQSVFSYAGAVDMAISVASLRAAPTKTCKPVFTAAAKSLNAEKIYHPLIENCITNDINTNGKSILITGSNMSGKTTFLRTIAINSVLAQTIFTCFSDSYQAPFLQLFSSIRIDDSVLEGKSYYFEEVNIMASLVKEAASHHQNLFILDEVFKGTNTVERIASAKAILSYLNSNNNIVFVSTHDIELSDLLKTEYDLYHFEENIAGNELQFDHTLKPGQLTTRNAIRILEMAAYPAAIIEEANAISKNLSLTGHR